MFRSFILDVFEFRRFSALCKKDTQVKLDKSQLSQFCSICFLRLLNIVQKTLREGGIYNFSPVRLAGHYLGYVECFQDPMKTFFDESKACNTLFAKQVLFKCIVEAM